MDVTVSADLQQETTQLLQRLIRCNTVNPPGNERVLQEGLAADLRDAGFEVDLLGAEPERPNLVARLRGTADGPVLCLLSHVDTVLATPADWTHDPWSGDLADGFVWGRGALDMKSQTAAEIAAALSLAREGWRPAQGDLLVVVVVDEEVGGELGAMWICEHHPEKVRCDYLLNEGAGSHFMYDGARHYGVCVAEKGVFRFRVTTDGVAGHASIPKIGVNALLKMAPLLTRMAERQPGLDLTGGDDRAARGAGVAPRRRRGRATRSAPAPARTRRRPRAARRAVARRHAGADADLGLGEDQRHSRERGAARRLPRSAWAGRGACPRADPRGPGRGRLPSSSSPSGWIGNASPVQSPLMDAIEGWVHDQRPRCARRADDAARLHRLAHVPRRLSRSAWPTASSRIVT